MDLWSMFFHKPGTCRQRGNAIFAGEYERYDALVCALEREYVPAGEVASVSLALRIDGIVTHYLMLRHIQVRLQWEGALRSKDPSVAVAIPKAGKRTKKSISPEFLCDAIANPLLEIYVKSHEALRKALKELPEVVQESSRGRISPSGLADVLKVMMVEDAEYDSGRVGGFDGRAEVPTCESSGVETGEGGACDA